MTELIFGVTTDVSLMSGFSLWFPDTADPLGNDFTHVFSGNTPPLGSLQLYEEWYLDAVCPYHQQLNGSSRLFMHSVAHKNLSF